MSTQARTAPTEVSEMVDRVSEALSTHAGGIELLEVTQDGTVRLAYTGMCAGCRYRPLTTAGTVEPALLDVEGVRAVEIQGSRISDAARRRLEAVYVAPARPAGRRRDSHNSSRPEQ